MRPGLLTLIYLLLVLAYLCIPFWLLIRQARAARRLERVEQKLDRLTALLRSALGEAGE